MIETNPFTSNTFVRYWSKHFLTKNEPLNFRFFKNLSFYKSKFPGIYINAGKNLTKGISYKLDYTNIEEIKGKTFLIYDVVDSHDEKIASKNSTIGKFTVKQYPGFLIDLKAHNTLDEFMSKTFKKSSRYKLRKYKKRLEECFDISFKAHYGDVSKEEFKTIFDHFRSLLEKRFGEKKISNNNLDSREWNFYKDVAYPMIQEKKAALFVLYNNNEPISITLTYFSENRIFDAITVFDIDYAKFHLGSVTIMKLVEWSIENDLEIFDFSKGYFDYKKRWASKEYDFEYHILYDSKSIKSKLLAFALKSFYESKQYLRDKKVNELLHKLTFWLRNKNTSKKNKLSYNFVEPQKGYSNDELTKISCGINENHFLKEPVFDFLYLNSEKLDTLQTFKIIRKNDCYLFKGERKILELNIKSSSG